MSAGCKNCYAERIARRFWGERAFLTKRPERAAKYFERLIGDARFMLNVWLGVSIEDQTSADERIPLLFQLPSMSRFVSAEPMLGSIELTYYLNGCPEMTAADAWVQTTPKLDWVICGGETGPGARPMDVDWALSLRNQCKDANVPFFFKQMGGKRKGIPQRLAIREFPR